MIRGICLIFLAAWLVGCSQPTPSPPITVQPAQTVTSSATSTSTASPIPQTPTAKPATEVPTATPELSICSPLDGIALIELPTLIFNPFAPPRLGSDDPHQGVDFADIDPVYQIAVEGRLVNAVLEGKVAGVISDRFPYGNAILVETSLDRLPDQWSANLQIPTPAAMRQDHPSLTCPEFSTNLDPNSESRSIYLIYAHFKEPVTVAPGDFVSCGQPIGAIGSSGNSLNPHLHLEMRVGPANTRFESMAHYTGSATPTEMANYCLWRVSDAFQLLNPMLLLLQDQ